MSIDKLAKDFTKAVANDDAQAYQSYWADDIVSLEPQDGPMARCEGREQLQQKHQWWNENTTVHATTTEGPCVFSDQFAVRYGMDVTMKNDNGDDERSQINEVGLYTVRGGKIAEERFFYGQS